MEKQNLIKKKSKSKSFRNILIIFNILITICFYFKLYYGIIFFLELPFTLLHELSHFIVILILIPNSKVSISISIEYSFVSFSVIGEEWKMVLFYLAGSIIVIFITYLFLIYLKNKNFKLKGALNNYLVYIILRNITNLLPILPKHRGGISDGYGWYFYLSMIFNLPQLTESISLIMFIVIIIIEFIAMQFLFSAILNIYFYLKYRIKKYNYRKNQGLKISNEIVNI